MGGGPTYEQPNYAEANTAAVQATAQNVSPLAKIQAAKTLGTQAVLSDSDIRAMGLDPANYAETDGGRVYTDFTGVGDDVLQENATQAYLDAIKTTTPELLKIQQQYGEDYAKANRAQLEAADPEKFAAYKKLADEVMGGSGATEDDTIASLRKAMGESYLSDVQAGSSLNDQQREFSEQQTRRSQMARGNVFGYAPSIEETLNALNLGETMKQTRMAGAQSFLSSGQDYETAANRMKQGNLSNLGSLATGTPVSSYFSGLNAAQQGASGQNATGSNIAGFNVTDSASAIGGLASSIYGTNAGMFNTAQQTQVDPSMAAAGMGTQLLSAKFIGGGKK